MKRALILVEGQTEERFVKDMVAPIFLEKKLIVSPTILNTKVVAGGANFKGRLTNVRNFTIDLNNLLRGSGGALVTTMLDFYGLPDDFPGMNDLPQQSSDMNKLHISRATHVERAISAAFNSPPNLLPFLSLHELEAWLFASETAAPDFLHFDATSKAEFRQICNRHLSPEEINSGIASAPSKRVIKLFPQYRKNIYGPKILSRIGIPAIRAKCPHFNQWFSRLEAYAEE